MLTKPCKALNILTLAPFLKESKRVLAVIWQDEETANNLVRKIVSNQNAHYQIVALFQEPTCNQALHRDTLGRNQQPLKFVN